MASASKRFTDLCSMDDFPDYEQNRYKANHCIREEKGWDIPVPGEENGITTDESHNERTRKSVISEHIVVESAPLSGILHSDLPAERLPEGSMR